MTDKTFEMLVAARSLLIKFVDINEAAVGRVSPRWKSLLSCAKRECLKPLPRERGDPP